MIDFESNPYLNCADVDYGLIPFYPTTKSVTNTSSYSKISRIFFKKAHMHGF